MQELTKTYDWQKPRPLINNEFYIVYTHCDRLNLIYVQYHKHKNIIEYFLTHNQTNYFLYSKSNIDKELIPI